MMAQNNSSTVKNADEKVDKKVDWASDSATGNKKTMRHAAPILSPHLGIYRWEVTMLLSIMHRFTGVALWLAAVAAVLLLGNQLLFHVFTISDAVLQVAQRFSYIVLLPLFFALVFHGLNGIRHFFWDMGWGYDIKVARASAWLVLGLSLLATIVVAALWWRARS